MSALGRPRFRPGAAWHRADEARPRCGELILEDAETVRSTHWWILALKAQRFIKTSADSLDSPLPGDCVFSPCRTGGLYARAVTNSP